MADMSCRVGRVIGFVQCSLYRFVGFLTTTEGFGNSVGRWYCCHLGMGYLVQLVQFITPSSSVPCLHDFMGFV